LNSSISWYVDSVSSENFTLIIFCSGWKNKFLIIITTHNIAITIISIHHDKMLFNFGLILNSGIDIQDLFNIFLKDFLRLL
jgi:hypothetical protein